MLISAVSGHAQIDITTGLIAHYPFDGNADDASVNGNHGTVMGAVLTTDALGRENSAYEFNGINAYITIPNSATLSSPDTELTIVALVNPYGDSKVGSPFGPILVKSNSGTNAFQYRFALDRGSSGFYVTVNNWGNNAIATMDIAVNKWHALAATVNGNTAKLYHNGRLIDIQPIQGPIKYDERPLEIGRDTPGAAEYFWGKIDDIRIFNRELTLEEVREASGILFFDSYETIE
jgi:hypothetical protein